MGGAGEATAVATVSPCDKEMTANGDSIQAAGDIAVIRPIGRFLPLIQPEKRPMRLFFLYAAGDGGFGHGSYGK